VFLADKRWLPYQHISALVFMASSKQAEYKMAKRDYYEVLGVGKTADDKELKSAFRKMAKQYHPDANPDDSSAEHKFKEISEAYEVLKEPQKRAAYDRFGHAAFEDGRGGAGFGPEFSSSMSDIFEDLFGEFMGGGGRRPGGRGNGAARGSDLRYDMEITLTDAYAGKSAQIRVPTSVSCGAVRSSSGFFTVERACPTCQGRGTVIADPCTECSGQGRVQKERTLSVNIPAGVEDGTRIRLANEGESGVRGGPAGDLYIFLAIKQHEFFQRDGADLFSRVPISMTSAALGGEIEVPTIDGKKARVTVPEGTQGGKQFRLKGKGMPVLRSSQRGDMYIQVSVETPVNLTRKQKELLRDFEGQAKDNSPQSAGFFTKARSFWDSFGS
jgi:molecular chaperone DnaJ